MGHDAFEVIELHFLTTEKTIDKDAIKKDDKLIGEKNKSGALEKAAAELEQRTKKHHLYHRHSNRGK